MNPVHPLEDKHEPAVTTWCRPTDRGEADQPEADRAGGGSARIHRARPRQPARSHRDPFGSENTATEPERTDKTAVQARPTPPAERRIGQELIDPSHRGNGSLERRTSVTREPLPINHYSHISREREYLTQLRMTGAPPTTE
jgi:hypothetical protein